jgi:hypothetical protein
MRPPVTTLNRIEDALHWMIGLSVHAQNGPMGAAFDNPKVYHTAGVGALVRNARWSADPFVGRTHLANRITHTNDVDETVPADTHMDALVFLRATPCETFDLVLLDPPRKMSCHEVCQLLNAARQTITSNGTIVLVTHSNLHLQRAEPVVKQHVVHMTDGIFIVAEYGKEQSAWTPGSTL